MNVRCDRMSLSKARCRKEGSQAGAPFFISAGLKINNHFKYFSLSKIVLSLFCHASLNYFFAERLMCKKCYFEREIFLNSSLK